MATLNVQNVHRWLTHIPAVACGSLSQHYQCFLTVTHNKLTKVHLKTVAFVKTAALPINLIIQWIEVR